MGHTSRLRDLPRLPGKSAPSRAWFEDGPLPGGGFGEMSLRLRDVGISANAFFDGLRLRSARDPSHKCSDMGNEGKSKGISPDESLELVTPLGQAPARSLDDRFGQPDPPRPGRGTHTGWAPSPVRRTGPGSLLSLGDSDGRFFRCRCPPHGGPAARLGVPGPDGPGGIDPPGSPVAPRRRLSPAGPREARPFPGYGHDPAADPPPKTRTLERGRWEGRVP